MAQIHCTRVNFGPGWTSEQYLEKLCSFCQVFFVTCKKESYHISSVRCHEVLELEYIQEEADGRLLCAVEGGYEAVIISSYETEVIVLNLAFCSATK